MIEVRGVTKRFGGRTAIDDLTFTVRPGAVTGFLGPNGAGKSTTMRVVLGLDRPTSGEALVQGVPYRMHKAPLRSVGSLLDATEIHPSRTAQAHLLALATTIGEGRTRVKEVLDRVGLEDVARTRSGKFSLGMRQRLGIAAALLGDPAVVILDEPMNGLDPEGVLWIRHLTRQLAQEGRTVLVSSHLMSEMSQTADHLIVIGRGKLLADTSMNEFLAADAPVALVRSPQVSELASVITSAGGAIVTAEGDRLEFTGLEPSVLGDTAAQRGIAIHELTSRSRSLEQAFMELTHESVEYRGTDLTDTTSSKEGTR